MNLQGRENIQKTSEWRVIGVDHRPGRCRSSTRACYACGKVGHIAMECNKSNQLGTYWTRRCYNCCKYGHLARNCSNKLGSAGVTAGSNTSTWLYRGRGTCYKCGVSGHFWRECTTRTQEKDLQLYNSSSSWSDISTDIFSLVTQRLLVDDVIRLGAVCKSWQQAIRVQPRCRASMPWVMNTMAFSCDFKVSDFWRNRIYYLDTTVNKDLEELCHNHHGKFNICDSKYGWLLLFKEYEYSITRQHKEFEVHFLLYNPFCNETIKLPPSHLLEDEHVEVAKFMTTPSGRSPTCDIFFMSYHNHGGGTKDYMLYTCNEDRRWSRHKIDVNAFDWYVKCDVAYADETLYCAFRSPGSVVMGSYSVALRHFAMDPSLSFNINGFDNLYLAEFDGDLYCISIKPCVCCHVYQLDRPRKVWSLVKSFGNRVLILSGRSSCIVVPAVGEAEEYAGMLFLYGNYELQAFISDTEGTWKLHQQHVLLDYSYSRNMKYICIQPPNLSVF